MVKVSDIIKLEFQPFLRFYLGRWRRALLLRRRCSYCFNPS